MVDQLTQIVKFPDRGDFGDVAFRKRACIGSEPRSPPRRYVANKHFREPSGEHATDQVRGRASSLEIREVRSERSLDESRRVLAFDLRLRERQQFDRLHPSGQRVRRDRALEQVHRPGDQELSRPGVLVHGPLDCQDQAWCPLDLIDYRCPVPAHESVRVVHGELPELFVVQTDERQSAVASDTACEGGLAGLARPHDGDDARIGHRFANQGLRMAREKLPAINRLARHPVPSNSECSNVRFGID